MQFGSKLLGLAVLAGLVPSTMASFGWMVNTCSAAVAIYPLSCGVEYSCECTSPIFVSSILACLHNISDSEPAIKEAAETQIGYCLEYGGVDVTFDEWNDMYQQAVAANNFTLTSDLANATAPLTTPIILTQAELTTALKTIKTFNWNYYSGTLFGGIILAYFMAVIVVGIIINIWKRAAPKSMLSMNSPAFVKFRQTFTMPALFGFRHSIPASWLKIFSAVLPTRAQGFVLLGYLVLNIILTMVKYELFIPNYYYFTYRLQLLRYLADRTGIISFCHFPPLFLFAGRNNMMIWATGWSFETFNVYHRWIARGMVMHAVIHSVAYSLLVVGTYKAQYAYAYWVWGVVATVLCCFMLGQSIHFLRSRWYETFLAIHIVLGVAFIIACWYHVVDLGWHQWIWAAVGIWAVDRLVRLIRIAYFGVAKSPATLYGDGIFKITITPPSRWKYYPGSHVFVHVLKPWGFWESHPFSLYPDPVKPNTYVIAATTKQGMTNRIANELAVLPGASKDYKLLVDGPYGSHHALQHYDTLIMIAGGIGFTAVYAYALDMLSRPDMNQNIIFVWITRHESSLKTFSAELEVLTSHERCTLQVFVTQTEKTGSESDDGANKVPSKTEGSDASILPAVTLGVRPDAYELLGAHIKASSGATGVMVCGPPTLNDTLRRSVTDNLGNGNGRVDYLEEAFSW